MTFSRIGAKMVSMQSNLRALWGVLITVIAIMSGILSLVREFLQFVDPVRFPERSLFLASAQIAFLVSVGFLWWQEKHARIVAETLLDKSKPQFELTTGDTIWQYRVTEGLTAIYVSAGLLNRGEPSVALGWSARYLLNGASEEMELFNIATPHVIQVDDQQVTFTNDNLINVKTLERPLLKGQWVGGRVLCTVRGDRTAQIMAAQFRIEISCADYTGKLYKATYTPSPTPPRTLRLHYSEQLQPARVLPPDSKTSQP
jgi:hypothetical protein